MGSQPNSANENQCCRERPKTVALAGGSAFFLCASLVACEGQRLAAHLHPVFVDSVVLLNVLDLFPRLTFWYNNSLEKNATFYTEKLFPAAFLKNRLVCLHFSTKSNNHNLITFTPTWVRIFSQASRTPLPFQPRKLPSPIPMSFCDRCFGWIHPSLCSQQPFFSTLPPPATCRPREAVRGSVSGRNCRMTPSPGGGAVAGCKAPPQNCSPPGADFCSRRK